MIQMNPGDSVGVRPLLWFGVLLVTALAIAVAFFIASRHRESVHAPVNERSRAELVLKDDRLFEPDGVTPFSGVVLENYEGGEMKSRSTVSNGLLQGLSQGWWTNGVLQVSEYFSNGVSHGVRTKYYPEGGKQSVANIVQGEIEGLYERWHENGTLAEQIHLTGGVADGESLGYHPDGSLKARVRLNHGKVIAQEFWPTGAVKP